MSVIISAHSSENRDFSDAANEAIDAKNISVSEGNWREHLSELFLPRDRGAHPIDAVERCVDAYISDYNGRPDVHEYYKWHLQLALQLKELVAVGREHGCDVIGVAG